MKQKIFLILSVVLVILLNLNVYSADVNTLEIINVTETNDPVETDEEFTISAQVKLESETFERIFETDFFFTGGADRSAQYGMVFAVDEKIKLHSIDINANAGKCGTVFDINGAIYDNNSDTPILNEPLNIISDKVAGAFNGISAASGGGGTNHGCRFNFESQDIFLNADVNYWFVFSDGNVAGATILVQISDVDPESVGLVFNAGTGRWDDINPLDFDFAVFKFISIQEFLLDNATVSMGFGQRPIAGMPFNATTQKYEFASSSSLDGVFNYGISATKTGNTSDDFNSTLTIFRDFRTNLTIRDLDNTNFIVDSNLVTVFPRSSDQPQFEFSVENTANNSLTVAYSSHQTDYDFDSDPEKIYHIYTKLQEGNNSNFNDTITFGDPVQKIWNPINERYDFSFNRLMTPLQTQFFLFDYKKPMISFKSFTNTSFFTTDNSLTKTSRNGRDLDLFSVTAHSRLLIEPTEDLPVLTSDETATTQHVLMFTASADNDLPVTVDGVTQTITSTKKTYSFNVSGDFNISSEVPTTFTRLEIEAFSISERGFFADTLEVVKLDGSALPVIIDNDNARQVIEEGQKFRIKTKVYEKGIAENQDLNIILIEAFVLDLQDSNKVFLKEINITENNFPNEIIINIDEIIEGIITTSETIDNLATLHIRVRACGKHRLEGIDEIICYAEQERKDLVLRQFPFSTSQFFMDLFVTENFVSKPVEGEVFVQTDFPENLEYIRLSVYEIGESPTESDWNKNFYKGADFDCIVDFCVLKFKSDDWAFEKATDYLIQATAKVRTSHLDFDNEILNVVYFLEAFTIGYKNKTLFLYNDSRDLDEYRDYEKIPMILELRDNLNLPSSDDLNIFIFAWDLGTTDFNGGADAEATFENIKFPWNFYQYDENTGTNRYAFLHRFREDSDAKLTDGHFYRFFARVIDHTGKRTAIIPITLSTKDTTGGYDSDANAFAQENETSIKIENTTSLSAPTIDQNGFFGFFCVDAQNKAAEVNLRQTGLLQAFDASNALFDPITFGLTGTLFRIGSSVSRSLITRDCHIFWIDGGFYVDQIKIFIYNNYSDLTETNDDHKAFMEVTIPTEDILFNDGFSSIVEMIDNAPPNCRAQFADDTIARAICAGASLFNGQITDLIDLGGDITNLVTNGTDLNVQKTINPKTRMIKFKVENLRPINLVDFETAGFNFKGIPPNKIFKYLVKDQGLEINGDNKAKITIYQNNKVLKTFFVENRLVERIKFAESFDSNGISISTTNFIIRTDLRYNEGRNSLDPKILLFTENVIVTRPLKPLDLILSECLTLEAFPSCTVGFFSTPEILVTFIIVSILLLIGLAIFMVIRKKTGRGTTIAIKNFFRKRR